MEYLQNFNYKILGNLQSEKYLVFLHGLMGSGINWSSIAKLFAEDYQILIYDQRGHGRSFQPQEGYHPNDYAEDLYKILRELDWDKINLVGHSMGGRNALSFAQLYPDSLQKLVIEDISPSIKIDAIEPMRNLINSVPVPFTNKKESQQFFKTEFLKQFENQEEAQVFAQFFQMNIIEKRTGVADWRCFKPGILQTLEAGRRQDAWPIVAGLSMPSLFIFGENSAEYDKEEESRLLTHSNIKTHCISNSGHWVHFDQAKEFVTVLQSFLRE